jgi:hypothetical protein
MALFPSSGDAYSDGSYGHIPKRSEFWIFIFYIHIKDDGLSPKDN